MSLLDASIRFSAAENGGWLAVNADKGGAFAVNGRTRELMRALQQHDLMEQAHVAFEQATGEQIALDVFSSNATVIIEKLEQRYTAARDQLSIGMTLLSPRYFSAIARPFKFLIAPGWLFLAAAALLPLLLWLCLREDALSTSLSVYRQGFTGLGVILLSVVFHEIGHAAALLRHGRVVGALGAGVNLIFPALYTEIHEHAVMGRLEKLWLNIAGIYFQVLFAHLVVLASALAGEPLLRHYAVIIYLLALFQLLPLNRQDGMWLVSDLMARHGKAFRVWTQTLSMLIALGLVYYMVSRVLIPYWEARVLLMRYGAHAFAGGAAQHVSGIVGTLIVAAWAVRIARSVYAAAWRRRAAHLAATN